MIEATKSNPAPLDAFETAKPLEPIWTVQGGDPLGAPLLRIWAIFARIQADVIPAQGTEIIYEQILKMARANVPDNQRDREGLLIRATLTEEISWQMDEYRKGNFGDEIIEHKTFDEFAQLDIYDIRRRCASLISAFSGELAAYREQLLKYEFLTEELDNAIQGLILALQTIRASIEIRRER